MTPATESLGLFGTRLSVVEGLRRLPSEQEVPGSSPAGEPNVPSILLTFGSTFELLIHQDFKYFIGGIKKSVPCSSTPFHLFPEPFTMAGRTRSSWNSSTRASKPTTGRSRKCAILTIKDSSNRSENCSKSESRPRILT
ncbi:unnamed protein product, partial [Nesidiocoris tenuis]